MQHLSNEADAGSIPRRRLDVRYEPLSVHVAGEIDIATAAQFADVLRRCEHDLLVHTLDLSEVEFFSAAGVQCFVDRQWHICPHPAIVASAAVRRVLALCGFEYLLARHGWRLAFEGWHCPPHPN